MSADGTVAILGLGYVGLPLAHAFAGAGRRVIGFDTDATRVGELSRGVDRNDPDGRPVAVAEPLTFTADAADLAAADIFVIAVPTPVVVGNVIGKPSVARTAR